MKTRISIATLILVAISVPLAANNWNHIDAHLNNHIGAPNASETTQLVIPTNEAIARLAVAGDVGTGGVVAYRTGAIMDTLDEQRPYDALLLLGDNVYDNGNPDDVLERVLYPFGAVLDQDTELIAVLGNHDVRNNNGPAQAAALGMPNDWYVTGIDNISIVALNSNEPSSPEQREWLDTTLTTLDTEWTIVIMHHSPYSAGWHGNNSPVIENFVPLFEKHRVDLVLTGHDHDYQRTKPINGITYIVTGAAARTRPAGRDDFTAASWSTPSFVDVTVYDDRMLIQAVDHRGRAIDSVELLAK